MTITLQLGHAGEGVEISLRRSRTLRQTRFNWATPVKAWRFRMTRATVRRLLLQLGHAGEGVEMHPWPLVTY